MKKTKILGIAFGVVFCVMIIKVIVPPSLLNYDRLLVLFGFKESEEEVVLEETNIELKGVSDPKKIVYEIDNAIIKVSYNIAEEYLLQKIKDYQSAIRTDELLLSGTYKDHPAIVERKKKREYLLKEGEDFMDWLDSQNNSNEINITNAPHNRFLKDIYFEDKISIFLRNGEAEVFDRISFQNVKFIIFKRTSLESYQIIRFYLPSNEVFFERSFSGY